MGKSTTSTDSDARLYRFRFIPLSNLIPHLIQPSIIFISSRVPLCDVYDDFTVTVEYLGLSNCLASSLLKLHMSQLF